MMVFAYAHHQTDGDVVAGFSPRSTRWKRTRAKARDYMPESTSGDSPSGSKVKKSCLHERLNILGRRNQRSRARAFGYGARSVLETLRTMTPFCCSTIFETIIRGTTRPVFRGIRTAG